MQLLQGSVLWKKMDKKETILLLMEKKKNVITIH